MGNPQQRASRRPQLKRVYLLTIPKVAPDWELSAIQALIKPQLRGPIKYRPARQPWSPDASAIVRQTCEAFQTALSDLSGGFFDLENALKLEFPAAGEFRLIARFSEDDLPLARGLAVLLSAQMPGIWYGVHRLFVRDGRFFRRQYGYKLKIVEARNIHLPRAIRSAVDAAKRALNSSSSTEQSIHVPRTRRAPVNRNAKPQPVDRRHRTDPEAASAAPRRRGIRDYLHSAHDRGDHDQRERRPGREK
jgi:hypothetical protein